MNQLLTLGQSVHTQISAVECTVEKYLGGGAQGEVYQAMLAGQPVALKWYFPHYLKQDPTLRQRIACNSDSADCAAAENAKMNVKLSPNAIRCIRVM